MIELKSVEQMRNSIEKARANRKNLIVRITKVTRQYEVYNRNTNRSYLVRFFRSESGRRFGKCNCKAGENNQLCYHAAAAVSLHIYMMGRLHPAIK